MYINIFLNSMFDHIWKNFFDFTQQNTGENLRMYKKNWNSGF